MKELDMRSSKMLKEHVEKLPKPTPISTRMRMPVLAITVSFFLDNNNEREKNNNSSQHSM